MSGFKSRPAALLKPLIPVALKRCARQLFDLAFYALMPKKTIVIIFCTMRSGSTLLKALLAEADDVSHLPEVDFRSFGRNKYAFYRRAYRLSKKRIVVLKRPDWFNDKSSLREAVPDLKEIKLIFLFREVDGVVRSLQSLFGDNKPKQELIDYWVRTNEDLLANVSLTKRLYRSVHYEDLLKNPKRITKDLFSFIGSTKEDGVDNYRNPEHFEWEWGSDDGGRLIKSLKVDVDKLKEAVDPSMRNCKDVQRLRKQLGFER
jgi:hypothetical protein